MCKNDYTFFTNVVRLCAYITLNIKKNNNNYIQTQKNLCFH